MLKWMVGRQVDAFEREWGYDAGYVREILAVAGIRPMQFLGGAASMGAYRRGVPAAPFFAAKILGALAEDCGPCTQLVVRMAEREGVDPKTLRALIEGRDDALPADVRLAAEFARAVIAHDVAADPLRERIVAAWGKPAVVSLAFAIAASRIFPTVKYAMGFGHVCSRVTVGSVSVVPAALAVT